MDDAVDLARIHAAAAAGESVVRETPVLESRMLSERLGAAIALKAESLQRTGSFKLRGALAKLAALGDGARSGVVAGSAGNHGQAVAYAARARGVACEIVMPATAPITKVEACRAAGAHVRLVPGSVDDAVTAAHEQAAQTNRAFVHPYDDPDVVAGQGGVGLELAAQVPQLARVVVPLGGGGLASGVAIAVKALRPDVDVIAVRIEQHANTIADGIAVKRPGELTQSLMRQHVDDVVSVGEDDVAEAMVMLMEHSKLVVEGAGAIGVAALLNGTLAPALAGTTAVVLSGGNVDIGLLASLARRHESVAGRRLVLVTTLPDQPGELGRLLSLVAAQGANLLDVVHLREGVALHVRESAVQLVLETRDREHALAVRAAVADAGYALHMLAR